MNGKGGFGMSEKRFTSYYERGNEAVIEDNGKRLSNKKVVDLLNELAEENEQLKEILNKLEEAIEKRGYDNIDEFW